MSSPELPPQVDTDAVWEQWGSRDPYYGVLTAPEYRTASMTAAAREAFFASGVEHVEHVLRVARAHLDADFTPARVLDFGCGVGRLLLPFASQAKEVLGLDISPSMLAEARGNCRERGLAHVELGLSDDRLSAAPGSFDLVHSAIVLQHIPVERGRALFAQLVGKVAPGGIGVIHVTFAWDAHAATLGQVPLPSQPPTPSIPNRLLRRLKPKKRSGSESLPPVARNDIDPAMPMYFYNLSELLFIVQRAGASSLHTELTDHGGAIGALLYFRLPG